MAAEPSAEWDAAAAQPSPPTPAAAADPVRYEPPAAAPEVDISDVHELFYHVRKLMAEDETQFVLDEESFMAAIEEPMPLFLTAPAVHLRRQTTARQSFLGRLGRGIYARIGLDTNG